MKRDMDLIRKILLVIEEQYVDTALYNIEVEDYNMKAIAYHCKILHDAGLISDYDDWYADDELQGFGVSSLTWDGHEFLDKIRDNTVWNKTKTVMKEKGLPFAIETIKKISSTIVQEMTKVAIKGITS